MKIPAMQRASNPLATLEAQDTFIRSQIERFGLKIGDISACSFLNGDFKLWVRSEKRVIIDLIHSKVYGKNKRKYLGELENCRHGETSLIVA